VQIGRLTTLAIAALVLNSAACESNPTATNTLSGNYSLTQLVTTSSTGTQTNQLAAGANGSLTLTTDGVSSGSIAVPADPQLGPATTLNLAGHWSLSNGLVTISTTADTFIRDMQLTWTGSQLIGDKTFNGTRVQVTFTH
jgi:hypothetical protein